LPEVNCVVITTPLCSFLSCCLAPPPAGGSRGSSRPWRRACSFRIRGLRNIAGGSGTPHICRWHERSQRWADRPRCAAWRAGSEAPRIRARTTTMAMNTERNNIQVSGESGLGERARPSLGENSEIPWRQKLARPSSAVKARNRQPERSGRCAGPGVARTAEPGYAED
jgi:hypothetical protein